MPSSNIFRIMEAASTIFTILSAIGMALSFQNYDVFTAYGSYMKKKRMKIPWKKTGLAAGYAIRVNRQPS
jgi:hypothetical protein